jgi:Domain of unknown function (DUF1905)
VPPAPGAPGRRSLRAVHRFEAELWRTEGDGGWCFVTVPGDVSDDVRARTAASRRGFGSVRVQVTVGRTTWATSLFPDAARGAYLLPVKQAVRSREGMEAGDLVGVALELLGDAGRPASAG